jgi:hypothetical protein
LRDGRVFEQQQISFADECCPGQSRRSGPIDEHDSALDTVAVVLDLDLLPQNGRVVLVILQDGRQLEGELHSMSGRYEIGGETFDVWEIETLEDVT